MVGSALLEKGKPSLESHPIEDYSKRKYVDFRTTLLFKVEFWGHVKGSSFRRHVLKNLDVSDGFGESKISNFEVPVVDKDILGFDISMDDRLFVENFVAVTELFEEKPYLFLL